MSLDVYLLGDTHEEECICRCGHEHTRETREEFFSANITHNLNRMAEAAGIYQVVWRPEENEIERAKDLIEPLTRGIAELRADPIRFQQFNAKNGWGTYEQFLPWLQNYLAACKQYPEARVEASR